MDAALCNLRSDPHTIQDTWQASPPRLIEKNLRSRKGGQQGQGPGGAPSATGGCRCVYPLHLPSRQPSRLLLPATRSAHSSEHPAAHASEWCRCHTMRTHSLLTPPMTMRGRVTAWSHVTDDETEAHVGRPGSRSCRVEGLSAAPGIGLRPSLQRVNRAGEERGHRQRTGPRRGSAGSPPLALHPTLLLRATGTIGALGAQGARGPGWRLVLSRAWAGEGHAGRWQK